ncbi:uncharacterized protein LOC106170043 [Lingula anatina]|uniref:Uncharacterized protein LOC106170043 n=1 Tax=Lingula anatina TaxID=7574 RepID=A0A1S3J4M8_LINAN|nr:uncharacterized protein LOC106170043 [Lingula anatina]|eukprot:XP_013405221.1 uncharacterized protein LOC106170043 [Lingula anatina]
MTMSIFVKYWFLLSCLPWACDLHGFSAAPGSRSRYRPNLGRLEAIQGSSCPGNRVPELVLGYTTPCSGERFFQLREFHFNNCQTCSRVLGDKITLYSCWCCPGDHATLSQCIECDRQGGGRRRARLRDDWF